MEELLNRNTKNIEWEVEEKEKYIPYQDIVITARYLDIVVEEEILVHVNTTDAYQQVIEHMIPLIAEKLFKP